MSRDPFLFGLTLDEFSNSALTILSTGLILYMLLIVGNLAKKTKAGKYGTLWLFLALGLGFTGFIAKNILTYLMQH